MDGQGKITFDDVELTGGKQISTNIWQSTDKKFTYIYDDTAKRLVINRALIIEDYEPGRLGINLEDAAPTPAPVISTEIKGDQDPLALDDWLMADSSNLYANMHMLGGQGNDLVMSQYGGNDLLEGNAGTDILIGGNGDDNVFGGDQTDYRAFIEASHTAQGTGQQGDWVGGGMGKDVLVGSHGNDVLMGGGGEDILVGGAGDDILDGDDNFYPTKDGAMDGGEFPERFYIAPKFDWNVSQDADNPYSDTFYSVANYSYARDVGAADIIYGGTGNDRISGLLGDDTLLGEDGDDIISGGDGSDTVLGGAGDDKLTGEYNGGLYGDGQPVLQPGDDYIDGGAGKDFIQGEQGDDTLLGGDGNDEIYGDAKYGDDATLRSNDYLDGEAGNDTLVGGGGADELFGGTGDDRLFGDADYVAVDAQGGDYLDGEEGDDYLRGYGGNDELFGGEGNDQLLGEAGDDYLGGEAGNDQLDGGEGNDTLDGGLGADILDGGTGDDTYLNVGADDTVFDEEGQNTILFAEGITADDIGIASVNFNGTPTLVMDIGGHEFLQIKDSQAGGVQSYQFADGTVLGHQQLLGQRFFQSQSVDGADGDDVLRGYAGNDTLYGEAGNDTLLGYAGNDTLDGGAGNDVLQGGAGNDFLSGGEGGDVYLFARGDGQDIILDDDAGTAGADAIRFAADISQADVTISRQANGDLLLKLVSGLDQITVQGWYGNPLNRIERIEFGDGTSLAAADLDNLTVAPIEGTGLDDTLTGTSYDDLILGHAGNDTLDGGAGNDILEGGEGDDILDGGAGNDMIAGGEGMDTFRMGYGIGADAWRDEGVNVVQLDTGLNFDSLTARMEGNDLVLGIRASTERAVIEGAGNNGSVWRVRDAAGNETDTADILARIEARTQRWLEESVAEYKAGIYAQYAAMYVQSGYHTISDGTFLQSAQSQASAGFVSGTQYQSRDYFIWSSGAEWTEYNTYSLDSWYTAIGATIFDKTATLTWQTVTGNVENLYADPVQYGFAQSFDSPLVEMAWHVTSNGATSDSQHSSVGFIYGPGTGYDVEAIGTIYTQNRFVSHTGNVVGQIVGMAPPGAIVPSYKTLFPLYGYASRTLESTTITFSEIKAGNADNYIYDGMMVDGGGGNDQIFTAGFAQGGEGDDALYGAAIMAGGPGNDYLEGEMGVNRILVLPTEVGNDLVWDVGLPADEQWRSYYESMGIEDWRERLRYGGKYVLWEGEGDGSFDTLEELAAELEYYDFGTVEEAMASGIVEYVEKLPALPATANDYRGLEPLYAAGVIERDTVEFGPGVVLGDLAFGWGRAAVDETPYVTLEVSWGTDGRVRIVIPHSDDPVGMGVETFRFSDGTEMNMADLIALAPPAPDFDLPGEVLFQLGVFQQLDSAPVAVVMAQGVKPEDVLLRRDGQDLLISSSDGSSEMRIPGWYADPAAIPQTSVIFSDGMVWNSGALTSGGLVADGTLGDDVIQAAEGFANTLIGGQGNDTLLGGNGNDTYVFNPGDGVDRIFDSGGVDTLQFGSGITPDSLSLGLGSLLVRVGNQGDAIHIEGFNPDDPLASSGIEKFQFADGTVLDAAELLRRGFDIRGSDEDDLLTGTAINDRISGGKGDDVLAGGGGNDTYVFNLGDGVDIIVDASSVAEGNLVAFGAGIAPSDLAFERDGADLLIRVGSQGDAVRLRNFDRFGNNGSLVADTLEFADGSQASLFQLTNAAPIVGTAPQNQVAMEDAPFLFQLPVDTFTDTDIGDTLGYAATLADGSALPAWLSFDPAIRTFSGVPGNADVGIVNVRVSVTDGAGASAETFIALNVANVNDTPTSMVIDGQAAIEDTPFMFQLPADAFTDIDAGDVLSYSATLDDGSPLPAWLAFDPATLMFSGTPANGDVGVMSLKVTTTDLAGASASEAFNLTVTNVNDAPELVQAVAGQMTLEDAPYSFTLPVEMFADMDAGDALSYSATLADGSALPAWLVFDEATRSFSGAPTNEDVGTLDIRVTATDLAGANASTAFSLEVQNVNDAPVLVTPWGNRAAIEDMAFTFTVPAEAFTDVDQGDTLTYSAILADGTPLPSWLAFDPATRTFSGTPSNGDVGTVSVSVTATDLFGASASSLFDLGVVNTNDAPVAASAISDQNAAEDAAFSFTVPVDAFTDLDAGDALAYAVTLADGMPLPQWLVFDPATRTFSGIPTNEDVGSLEVTVTATDLVGATVSGTFVLSIANVNDAPVMTQALSDVATMEDVPFSFTVPAEAFTDEDFIHGDSLSYSAAMADGTTLPGWLSFDAVTQTFSGTPANADVGAIQVKVVATDISGMAAESAFSLSVENVNDIPVVVTPLADRQAAANTDISWQLPTGSFADVDQGDTLSYSAQLVDGSALPSWLKFDAAAQAFSGHVPNDAKGSMDIQVVASDGHGAQSIASDVFRVSFANGHCDGHGNEGVGNGQDAPPPGHDYNWNDGPGASPGHPGSRGGRDDERRSKHGKGKSCDDDHDDGSDRDDRNKLFSQSYLDLKKLDKHYEDFSGTRREHDTCATVARWIEVDLAVSRQMAMEDKSLPWLRQGHGADIAALHQASAGFLGSKTGCGVDSFSLSACAGTQLKSFRGLQEGMQRIG